MRLLTPLTVYLIAALLIAGWVGAYLVEMRLESHVIAAEEAAKNTQSKVADLLNKIEVKVETTKGKSPFVTLTVDSNYTIRRTVIESEFAKNLTWNINRNGHEVLGRKAQNETQYTYFANTPGFYAVYVTAFIDGTYRVISNVVFYEVKNAEQSRPANLAPLGG